jgi:hypothetical protein
MKDVYVEEEFQEFRKLVVATKFSQVYAGVGDIVSGITSSITLRLLFWVIERMDEDNLIVIRKSEKLDFSFKCFKAGAERRSISSINRSIKELVDKGIMFPTSEKGERLGRFFVNPGYFWKSKGQQDRTDRIKDYYQFKKQKADEKN